MEGSDISSIIRDHRTRKGLSQEQLAIETGLNLRTIQRIENGETVPRGDSLRRLAIALDTSPDELINWKTKEDNNVLTILILSQLSFIAFPILGIIIPLIIWVLQKDKIKGVYEVGKSILNFQASWVLIFFSLSGIFMLSKILHINMGISSSIAIPILFLMYGYNLLIIVINAFLNWSKKSTFFKPAISFLS